MFIMIVIMRLLNASAALQTQMRIADQFHASRAAASSHPLQHTLNPPTRWRFLRLLPRGIAVQAAVARLAPVAGVQNSDLKP